MKELKEMLPVISNQENGQLSTHLRIGEEAHFEKALSEPKIQELTDQSTLRAALKYIMLLIGMRQKTIDEMEEPQKMMLIQYIEKYYGGHTLAEIRLAFEMAIAGKLDIAEKDVRAYENFTVIYFAGVMNAYRKWAKDEYKLVEHREIKSLPPSPPQNYDWREMIETEYQTFIKPQSVMFKLWPAEFYDQLVSDGFIAPDAFTDRLGEAKTNLCADIQKQIISAQGLSNGDKYTGVSDLEKRLVEIREDKRGPEVNLLAKQMTVLSLFDAVEFKNYKNIYIHETK